MTTYASTILADNPIAYWRLGETAGSTTAADATGNGHTGTTSGTTTFGQTGLLTGDSDTAIQTSGPGKVTVPHSAAFNNSTLTVEAWIKSPANTLYMLVRDSALVSGTGRQFQFRVTSSQFQFIVFIGGSAKTVALSTTGYTTGTHHVVGVYDGTNALLYVDGVQKATLAAAGTLDSASNCALWIAYTLTTGLSAVYDEIAIYGTALSATKISTHYNAGLGTFPSSGFRGWGVPIR